jgi:hypothetical protein
VSSVVRYRRFMPPAVRAATGILLALAAAQGTTAAAAATIARWVQLGPDGAVSARAITDGGPCPMLVADGTAIAMATRSEPRAPFAGVAPADFAARGCEIAVPAGTIGATIDGQPLPLPRPDPRRILLIGDTGCRLKGSEEVQDCNDGAAWPFARIAASAAAARPDLVIHVGDYHYRETACPVGRGGCAGSPFGYGWDTWRADFFDPATPLLAAAPWVMVRGNHEDCGRAGEGWFRFLDAAPMTASCQDLTGVWLARLGALGLLVVDGANAPDPKGDAAPLVAKLRAQFAPVAARAPAETWLATHRPLDAVRGEPEEAPVANKVENGVLEAALGALMPEGVRMIVSGHIHFFQAIDYGDARPAQLVTGMGGDNLSAAAPAPVAGTSVNGRVAAHATTRSAFGYMTWDRDGAEWSGTVFDLAGKPVARCRLAGRSLTCGNS